MKRALLAVCALLAACSHGVVPKTQVRHAPITARATASPNASYELAALGLRLQAPCAPEPFQLDQTVADGPLQALGATCTADGQTYFVARFFRGGRDRAADPAMLKNAHRLMRTISRETAVSLGEWPGVQLEGAAKSGHPTLLRSFIVGDGFWLAQVERPDGALDRTRAQAFLDSISITQPWSVHAFPEGHFSALLPEGGVRLDKKALGGEEFTVAEGSWLGGSQTRLFVVWSRALEGDAPPDERMDTVQGTLENQGYRLIWQAPIEVDGARGRDFLTQNKSSWMRLRMIVTAGNLYMLQASAATKDALLDESVPRFLASLRWFAE